MLIVQSFDKRKDEQFRLGEKIMPAFIGDIVLGGKCGKFVSRNAISFVGQNVIRFHKGGRC